MVQLHVQPRAPRTPSGTPHTPRAQTDRQTDTHRQRFAPRWGRCIDAHGKGSRRIRHKQKTKLRKENKTLKTGFAHVRRQQKTETEVRPITTPTHKGKT